MEDIIALLKNKDEKGLSLLYDHYAAALLGVIVRIVNNKSLGEEILQKTFLKAWNNFDSYDASKGNLFTWLIKIAKNSAIDEVRLKGHKKRMMTDSMENAFEGTKVETIKTDNIDTKTLLAALKSEQRVILDMVYLQGYTHRETAEILELPLGTVKTRLRLSIKVLREVLKDEQGLFLGLLFLITLIILMTWS